MKFFEFCGEDFGEEDDDEVWRGEGRKERGRKEGEKGVCDYNRLLEMGMGMGKEGINGEVRRVKDNEGK